MIGTYGGAAVRGKLAASFGKDPPAAFIEDVVAIVGAYLIVSACLHLAAHDELRRDHHRRRPGRPSLAGRLTDAGKTVAIIERKHVGGTCVNTGCKPTKTLVASAYAAHLARRGADYGVVLDGAVKIDMPPVNARSHKVTLDSAPRQRELAGRHAELHAHPRPCPLRGHARPCGSATRC